MKVHSALITFGAALAVGTGALLIPLTGSQAAATTHTLKFTAITQRQANLNRTTFAQDEVDKNKAGNVIGFDVINGVFDPTTGTATGHVALSTKGGMIFGRLRFSNGPVTRGTVTGGTGQYHGITGTIYGKTLNAKGTRTAVTVTYH